MSPNIPFVDNLAPITLYNPNMSRAKRLFLSLLARIIQKEAINRRILTLTSLDLVRKFLGRDFLSPIQQFALDGYSERLYSGLDLTERSSVLVLGGYHGDSADSYLRKYNCRLLIVEPIPQFISVLQSKFSDNPNVRIFPIAVSDEDKIINLNVQGEMTSEFSASPTKLTVSAVDISNFLSSLPESITLLEINIEGGEYSILKCLIDNENISEIPILQIQFHNFGLDTELSRAEIRSSLALSHELIFCYDWVWERWQQKKKSNI
jgi:FkbM family methyltransferase